MSVSACTGVCSSSFSHHHQLPSYGSELSHCESLLSLLRPSTTTGQVYSPSPRPSFPPCLPSFLPSTLLLASSVSWSGWKPTVPDPWERGVGGGGVGREAGNALLMNHSSPSLFQWAGWSLPFWACHMCVVVTCFLQSCFCVSVLEAARMLSEDLSQPGFAWQIALSS